MRRFDEEAAGAPQDCGAKDEQEWRVGGLPAIMEQSSHRSMIS